MSFLEYALWGLLLAVHPFVLVGGGLLFLTSDLISPVLAFFTWLVQADTNYATTLLELQIARLVPNLKGA
jgi:hypothetical protein